MTTDTLLLTKDQIKKMAQLVERFPEIDDYTLEIDNSSGIGPTYTIKFSLYLDNDFKVDITDVTTW